MLDKVELVEPTERKDYPAFWKPGSGKHKVVFLNEGSMQKAVIDGEDMDMFYVQIGVDGETYTWSSRYREKVTEISVLGQLKKLEQKFGKLDGISVNVIISGTGQQRRYTVDLESAAKTKSDQKKDWLK